MYVHMNTDLAMSMKKFDFRKPMASFKGRLSPIALQKSASNPANEEGPADSEAEHLYVLVHGFNSKPGHLKYVADRMKEKLGVLRERK